MLVIVLLFSSSSILLARTDASKGEIQGDSVSLPISLIRKANIKLIQAESDAELKGQLIKLVDTYKEENVILKSTIDSQKKTLMEAAKINGDLRLKNKGIKKERNISYAINGGFVGILLMIILL